MIYITFIITMADTHKFNGVLGGEPDEGDWLKNSSYYNGGDCGCVSGGGLFRDATTLPGLAISGNALAIVTSFVIVCIVGLVLLVVLMGVEISGGKFWLTVLVFSVGGWFVWHFEAYEGQKTNQEQTYWWGPNSPNSPNWSLLSKYSK
jgi:hypothetical protein